MKLHNTMTPDEEDALNKHLSEKSSKLLRNPLEFFRPDERAAIEKYRVETLRHAANAIFNKLNEAGFCQGTEQAKTAIMEAQSLANVIVQSTHAELPIGMNP